MRVKHVLIVDDDPDIRRIAQLSLERVGRLQVSEAASGAAALALLETRSPDVVLLDLMMPDLDGATTLLRIQETLGPAAPPVIFLTARTQRADQDRLLALGAVGVIPKPFDPLSLPEQLQDLLRSRG